MSFAVEFLAFAVGMLAASWDRVFYNLCTWLVLLSWILVIRRYSNQILGHMTASDSNYMMIPEIEKHHQKQY